MPVTPTLELKLSGVWTDVTDHTLRRAPIAWKRGIFDRGPLARLAGPGSISFLLNNAPPDGPTGYYSPGHANVRAGFDRGIGVRLKLSDGTNTRYVWNGFLHTIDPIPGLYGSKEVVCVGSDWMALFLDTDAANLVLRENTTCDVALDDLFDLVDVAPLNLDLDVGTDTLPFVFDDLGGGVPKNGQIAHDLLMSEQGYLYPRGNATDGETITLENRLARASASVVGTFTQNDIVAEPDALEVPSSRDQVINDVEVLTVPREVDAAATTVLVQLESPIQVTTLKSEFVFMDYRDPTNPTAWVGGKDTVTPVANTDFTAWQNEDGTGTDRTANVTIVRAEFGSRVMLELSTTADCYVRGAGGAAGMRVRGRGLYRYAPVGSRAENASSIAAYKRRQLGQPIVLPYQPSRIIGQDVANFVVNAWGGVGRSPRRVRPMTEQDGALLAHGINRDIGDKVTVSEDITALAAAPVFIHGIEQELQPNGTLATWWTLAPGDVVWNTIAPPSNLVATGVSAVLGRIDLTWTNTVVGATTKIYRDGVLVHTAASGVTSWTENSLANDTSYTYHLRHEIGGIESSNSVADAGVTCPVSPTNLNAVEVNHEAGRIDVQWTNVNAGAQTRVYRNSVLVHTAGVGTTTFSDTGLSAATSYSYFVRHYKNGLESPSSGSDSAFTAPASPTGFVANGVTEVLGRVDMSWTSGDGSAETRIYRDGVLVHTAAAGVTSWSNTGLAVTATQYQYSARHYRNSIESVPANDDAWTSPATPTGLAIQVVSDTELLLSWTNQDVNAQTEVYRDAVLVQTLAAGVSSWGNSLLTRATNYTYTLKHLRNSLRSPVSGGVVGRPRVIATGGTESSSGGYRRHIFDSVGGGHIFNITAPGVIDEIIIIAGGSGGGGGADTEDHRGGGGGAGGVLFKTNETEPSGSHAVTVGDGGGGGAVNTSGASGGNSSYRSDTVTGGGGGGAGRDGTGDGGATGGSGGGGGGGDIGGSGAAGTGGQGNAGANGTSNAGGAANGGGGGGKGGAGSGATGGAGLSTFAGTVAAGGDGSGGGASGTNYGDGGDGGSAAAVGGAGFKGAVLIRYLE